jgi:hypothetical protein
VSADKPTVYEALGAVMTDVQAVAKKDRNDAQRFNFRGIDAVVNAVGPALRKHGVTVSPRVDLYEYGTVTTSGGKPMGHVRVLVTYTFHGPAGDSLPAQAAGEAFDAGDKATPKAMSVAFRTALLQALALPTDEPDPDTQTYERAAPVAAPPPPTFDELLLDGEHATSTDALNALARRAVAVHAAGHLTEQQLEVLKGVVKARRADLAPSQAGDQ